MARPVALLPGALLLLAALACGGFQLRPTAVPGSAGAAAGKPTETTKPARVTPYAHLGDTHSRSDQRTDYHAHPGDRDRGTCSQGKQHVCWQWGDQRAR